MACPEFIFGKWKPDLYGGKWKDKVGLAEFFIDTATLQESEARIQNRSGKVKRYDKYLTYFHFFHTIQLKNKQINPYYVNRIK